ncbi:TRF2-interacting telomeric protein/Rap1 C terminal domain-containing protein [Aspergillus karnatakaensis]|uniref:putative transcription factor Rap1 n=1 Tax=Aspergillus karnatakaensis TaxID=1810916 RepID=UPI003CCD96AD
MSLIGAEERERGGSGDGGLFQGMSFCISKFVPQRTRFRELVQQNGGTVKLLDKDADVHLVDHKRKDLPPNVSNAYSYQFIEKSLRNGRLEDLATHRVDPPTARPIGATHIPAKRSRQAYTVSDDQYLWDYMQPYEHDSGASIRGNKIYQELGAKNPRHTWQSWRDRYLKNVRQGSARPGGMIESKADRPTVEEPSRTTTPKPTTSHRTEIDETSPRPQETKRKRSAEPIKSTESASNTAKATPQTMATSQQPFGSQPQVETVPPTHQTHQRKPSRSEAPPSPKKAKTTSNQSPATGNPERPLAEASSVLADFLELPFLPSLSSGPTPSVDEAPEQDIDSWIEERVRIGKGNEAQIIEALQCTSMDPDLADEVLDSLVAGKGIPDNMRGVWTAEDDKCVETEEGRTVNKAIEKHGSELFDARWEYLRLARDEGLHLS